MLNLGNILFNIPITLITLTLHECAHGYVSEKLGDPTPRYEGRLSLNPLVHLDLIGTLLMLFTGFGWAKPVSVNPMYYKDRKKGMALVAIAGPLANLALAVLGTIIYVVLLEVFAYSTSRILYGICRFFFIFTVRNLGLMVFNLIPIPPLDGSRVLGLFVPNRIYYSIMQYERYIILLIMLLSFSGAFDTIITTGVTALVNLLAGAVESVIGLIV